jgi:hypothetical protein
MTAASGHDKTSRRILADPATALAAIQDALQAARVELLVLDPYFGHHAPDWSALKKVSVPVRVLTMHKQNATQATSKKPAQSAVLISAHDDLQPLQRTYLFAVALRQAGALSQQDTASVTGFLAAASPDTVVHNPFTDHEGPLCLAVLDLAAL